MVSGMTKNDAVKMLEEYDALSCVDMIDMLRKEDSRLLYAGEEGVISRKSWTEQDMSRISSVFTMRI